MNQILAAQAAATALWEANKAIINATSRKTLPMWAISSKPYLKAIVKNDYGLEDPVMCVLYALNNLHNWRGPVARSIKADLKESIK